MNIPNVITVGRVFLVPLVVWLIISGEMLAAFLAFLAAGLSDALDGFLAKRYGWQTELGAYLDPIADKLLLVSIYISLGFFGHLPAWLVIAVVSRDLLIVGAFLLSWVMGRPLASRPLFVSKANTVMQIVLAAVVLGSLGIGLTAGPVLDILVWTVGALTLFSAGAYLKAWLRHMAVDDPPRASSPGQAAGRERREASVASRHKTAHGS